MARGALAFTESNLRRLLKCFAAEGFACVEAELLPDGKLVVFGCQGEPPADEPQPANDVDGKGKSWADAEPR